MKAQCSVCYKPAPPGSELCRECGGLLVEVAPPAAHPSSGIRCPWCNARTGNPADYASRTLYNCPHCTKAFKVVGSIPKRSDGISATAKVLILILFVIIVIPLIFMFFGV